jgi:hypothetical protein
MPGFPGQLCISMAPFVVLAAGRNAGSRNLGISERSVNVRLWRKLWSAYSLDPCRELLSPS